MEAIENLIKDLTKDCEKIGLYIQEYNVVTTDHEAAEADSSDSDSVFKDKLIKGESVWILQTLFSLGSVAFSSRVQNPEKEKEELQFKTIVPSEIELLREKIQREGLAAFRDDDDDDASDVG